MNEETKVLCPWCDKGEVYIEGAANVSISVMCPRCDRCFRVRLDSLTTERIRPHRKLPTTMKTYHMRGEVPPMNCTRITD